MIGCAQEINGCVVVLDENGNELFSKFGHLQGFTSTTVCVRDGIDGEISVYDERGNWKFGRPA